MRSQRTFQPKLFLSAFLLSVVLSLAGACASRSERAANAPAAHDATAATREVTDDAGRRVRVPLHPERIVTLAPNLTEIVYAVGAGNRLVGNTTYCDYPEEAKQVTKVGDTLHPSIERIIALRPQLIFVSTASQLETFTRQLDEQQIAVYVTDPHDLNGVLRSVATVGDLLDRREESERVSNELRARAAKVEEAVRSSTPLSVFYQLSAEPLYTAGRDSFITDLIARAGGRSVTRDVPGAWPRYSDEAALASKPEAIVMATGGSMGEANREIAAALKNSPAAKAGRIIQINGDFLSRPGPRLVDGLEQMAHALHPEAFKR
ncbi:MAG TPA: cobalamin-binding protein [Pyrinomonadaceae bacterium]|nr:cobalamin-binding protein [Pyrinomonadaceae bacterium]